MPPAITASQQAAVRRLERVRGGIPARTGGTCAGYACDAIRSPPPETDSGTPAPAGRAGGDPGSSGGAMMAGAAPRMSRKGKGFRPLKR